MRLFGKKNDVDEDLDEVDFEEVEERKFSARKPRGINSENNQAFPNPTRKKRKEPPKPWGRKERYIILFTLLGTVLASGVLAASARNWKLPGLPQLKVPSLSLFRNETIVVGNSNNSQKDSERAKRVISAFETQTKNLSGVYGLYVIELENGNSFGVNEKEKFQAASLIKLPVIVAFYKQVEIGKLNLKTKYTLKDSDKVGGSGSLSAKPAGTVLTLQELVDLMGKQSDNTAFGIIRKIVGDENIKLVIKKIGMDDTSLEENITTSYDIGIYFSKLFKGQLISQENKNKVLDSLTDTIYEDWLVAGIPPEVRVAHKYGREVHVINDAGVIFAKNPFIVVILSQGVVETEGDKVFPEIARVVYENVIK